jgi:hypothetical protein
MQKITIKYTIGKRAGTLGTRKVDSNLIGFVYEIGATFSQPGVGEWVIVSTERGHRPSAAQEFRRRLGAPLCSVPVRV